MRRRAPLLTLTAAFALALPSLLVAAVRAPASAMPIFAQRYQFACKQCHTALPELNDFGTKFRNNGYRLPPSVPRHGTTIAALRYNLEWLKDPPPGSRRWEPSSSILGQQDFGAISAYIHYGLGVQGGPGAPFLGFLSYRNVQTQTLYRLGLYELPLTHSPGQRLDDLSTYGYEGADVGQNDLALSAPRLGLEGERQFGEARVALSVALGEFKGAAYGGAPVATGTHTHAAAPELALFAQVPLFKNVTLNGAAIEGLRNLALIGRNPVEDGYTRLNAGIDATFFQKRLDLSAQQWIGRDGNADGVGDPLNSSGGWVRLKYFVTPHFYLASRLDDQAAPIASRKLVVYAGTFLTPHARLELQQTNDLIAGGKPVWVGSITTAVPWPAKP